MMKELIATIIAGSALGRIAGIKWGSKRYLSMERLYELERMTETV